MAAIALAGKTCATLGKVNGNHRVLRASIAPHLLHNAVLLGEKWEEQKKVFKDYEIFARPSVTKDRMISLLEQLLFLATLAILAFMLTGQTNESVVFSELTGFNEP